MTLDHVFNQLKSSVAGVLAQTKVCEEITRESNLFQFGLDSLGIMQLLVEIEDRFDITFSDDELSPELFERTSNLIEKIFSKVSERKSH